MATFVIISLELKNSGTSTFVRLTNAPYDIVYGGYTYQGSGDLLQIDGLDTTADLTTIGTTVTLQGVDPTYQAVIDQNGFLKAPIDIMLAEVPDGANIATTAAYWHRGYCDTPATTVDYEGETITIGVETQSIFQDLSRVPDLLRTSQANHQARHSGDRFFEYVADTPTTEIWRT